VDEKTNETIAIKIDIIAGIYKAVLPSYYKLGALIEDVVSGTVQLSDFEKATLFDHNSCAIALKVLFEEYFEQTQDSNTDTLYLPRMEYLNLISMARQVETSQRTMFGITGIWNN
jgi:hypothetical protein